MGFKQKLGVVVLVSLLAALVFVTLNSKKWTGTPVEVRGTDMGLPISILPTDSPTFHMEHPDVVIDTQSLSDLPRDMLRVPLLNDVLSESFVNYYEQHPTRLSIEGIVKRLAYEHDLDFTSSMVKSILTEPARVSVWRGPQQDLRYWAISMERGALAKTLTLLAKGVPSDQQLQVAGKLDGDPIYLVSLSRYRQMLLIARDDRMVILSDAGMLLDSQRQLIESRAKVVEAMLSDKISTQDQVVKNFDIQSLNKNSRHSILVDSAVLAFNYQRFFPAYEALRFELTATPTEQLTWSTSVLYNPTNPAGDSNARQLWSMVPHQPAMCASLPMDWNAVNDFSTQTLVDQVPPIDMSGLFDSSAGICWYNQSALKTPLIVLPFKQENTDPALNDQLLAYFKRVIAQASSHEQIPHQVIGNANVWTFPVSSRKGSGFSYIQQDDTLGLMSNDLFTTILDDMGARRGFAVSMAVLKDRVIFSSDIALMNQAIAVSQAMQPNVSDTMSPLQNQYTRLMIDPKSMSGLLSQEAQDSVSSNSYLSTLVDQRLQPRLDALAKYPSVKMLVNTEGINSRQWVNVDWDMTQQ